MRPQVLRNTKDMGPVTLNDGAGRPITSDDEDASDPPDVALSLHPPIRLF